MVLKQYTSTCTSSGQPAICHCCHTRPDRPARLSGVRTNPAPPDSETLQGLVTGQTLMTASTHESSDCFHQAAGDAAQIPGGR